MPTRPYRIFERRDLRLFSEDLDNEQLQLIEAVHRAFEEADDFPLSETRRGIFVSRIHYNNVMKILTGRVELAGRLPLDRYTTMMKKLYALPEARVQVEVADEHRPSRMATALSYVPYVGRSVAPELLQPEVTFMITVHIPRRVQYGPKELGSMQRTLMALRALYPERMSPIGTPATPMSAYHTPASSRRGSERRSLGKRPSAKRTPTPRRSMGMGKRKQAAKRK